MSEKGRRQGLRPTDADLEARQDAWVERQLANAPPLTSEARDLIKRLLGNKPEPRPGTTGVA